MSSTIERITLDQLKERSEQYKACQWSEFQGYTEAEALERVRTYGEPVAIMQGPESIGVVYIPKAMSATNDKPKATFYCPVCGNKIKR